MIIWHPLIIDPSTPAAARRDTGLQISERLDSLSNHFNNVVVLGASGIYIDVVEDATASHLELPNSQAGGRQALRRSVLADLSEMRMFSDTADTYLNPN